MTTDAPSRRDLARVLRLVDDPEVGVNIVDLGLVYDLRLEGGVAHVRLTMTTPACPMSGYITTQVEDVLFQLPAVADVRVELVWSPPWSPAMMDPDVRRARFGSPR